MRGVVKFLPLKRFVDPSRPITYGIVQAGDDVDGGVPYIRPIDMVGHTGVPDPSLLRTTSAAIAAAYRRSTVLQGDIVVSIGPSYGKTMEVPEELDGANLTQGTARVAPAAGVDGHYVRWALQSRSAIASWEAAVGGATFRALNLEPLSNTPIPSWPLASQRAVVDFLDAETSRVDALITKKRRMIRLLDERRQAAIQRQMAVSQSLLDFLLGAKRHAAKVVPLKRLVTEFMAGGTPDTEDSRYWASDFDDEAMPWIAIGDMVDRGVTTDTAKRVTREGLEAKNLIPGPRGTLLFAMYASVGKLTVTGIASVWNQAILGLIPNEQSVSVKFLAYWLELVRPHLGLLARSNTQDNLSAEVVRELPVPQMGIAKQERIVESLNGTLALLEAAQDTLRRQLELLMEHRQALITAAVTGEINIPEVAA